MMGSNFDNPWGKTNAKGVLLKMNAILNGGVFPGMQGGPLEHIIAAKAVAFEEALQPSFADYGKQVIENAGQLAEALTHKGYQLLTGGTSNHLMLIDLRNKNISGKEAEAALGKAGITVNKNMVPFDTASPFITSGIRIGTAAVTTRGLVASDMHQIAEWIDLSLSNTANDALLEQLRGDVTAFMSQLYLPA
jgi:glycine hydroxymethyltransferase